MKVFVGLNAEFEPGFGVVAMYTNQGLIVPATRTRRIYPAIDLEM